MVAAEAAKSTATARIVNVFMLLLPFLQCSGLHF